MATAHLAAELRISAMFDLPTVRALIRAERWRNLRLALLTVIAALPVAGAQILPAFIETSRPSFAELPPEVIAAVAMRWHVLPTFYLVLVSHLAAAGADALLRGSGAVYRITQDEFQPERRGAGRSPGGTAPAPRRRGRLGGFIAGLLLTAIWTAFTAQLYVAQFANHAWWNWLNHPLIGLPWIYRPL